MISSRFDRVDLRWSYAGDFIIKSGDLEDTYNHTGLGFIQEVTSRVSTGVGTWKTNKEFGSNVDQYEGRPNTEETGNIIVYDIVHALTKDGFLKEADFDVVPVPLSTDQILVRIVFNGILTGQSLNSTIFLNIIYDLTGKGPFIVK